MGLSIGMGDRRVPLDRVYHRAPRNPAGHHHGSPDGTGRAGGFDHPEILNRGNPTLLDLAVALVSGTAAAYALQPPRRLRRPW